MAKVTKIKENDKEKKSASKSAALKKSTAKKDTKKVSSTKAVSKKTSNKSEKKAAKKSTSKKVSTKKTSSTKVNKSTAKPMLSEYYDLPYRYNETLVKILAQTPTSLFVYWDISENDRKSLIEMHGENFFNETKPVLIVHNTTKNYSFEIEINDFANSWYIRNQEPDCDYVIELGRRSNKNQEQYVFINSSNDIVSPNNHILFENFNFGNVIFRNVKTGQISSKDFGSLRFINDIDKLYGNIYDVYSKLYSDNDLDEITNPSSGEFIMK